jgi:hypothetical protein
MLSRSRLIATGLAVAAVGAVAALAYAAIGGARTLPRLAAERGHPIAVAASGAGQDRLAQSREPKDALPAPKDLSPAAKSPPLSTRKDARSPDKPEARSVAPRAPQPPDRGVRVAAPDTEVDVDKERGKVRVRAPYTKVDVDPDRGQVRVRAPYVNLDIRW